MMKRILFAAALLAALPCSVSAQVEKRVEVTKAYVPSVESAAKLAVVPDMTDTVKMRPEIDYTITPLSLQTTLATRPRSSSAPTCGMSPATSSSRPRPAARPARTR